MPHASGPAALDDLERTRVVLEVLDLVGADADEVREVVRLHVDTVTAAYEVDAPELVAHQERWERVRLRTVGLTLGRDELRRALRESLGRRLTRSASVRLRMLYERADQVEPSLPRLQAESLSGPATRYLAAALAGRQDQAVGVVRRTLRAQGSVGDVVGSVLQPAQREVGRLWEAGEVDVAQEHTVTAITQTSLGMLGARLTTPDPSGRRMVAATVGDEGHEVGLRMLSTLVQERGWEVEYLGGGVPAASLLDHVGRSRPDVVALSATIFGHVRELRALIDALRRDEDTRGVKVLVGGRVFALSPDLARSVGADGFATDAVGALELFTEWFGADEPVREEFVEVDLADRYGFEDHHREGALEILSEETGFSVEDLRRGLSRIRR